MIRRLFLRWQYGWFMAHAYVAKHVDGEPDYQKFLSAANEAHRLWMRELIQ